MSNDRCPFCPALVKAHLPESVPKNYPHLERCLDQLTEIERGDCGGEFILCSVTAEVLIPMSRRFSLS